MKRLGIRTLLLAACVAVMASLAAMLPYSHRSEAAIAVFDERNIAEAVKTAIQTANILSEEQKQLALQILNMKKIEKPDLEDLIERNQKKQDSILAGDAIVPKGIINYGDKSVQAVWDERMGNIEDVINGNMTVVDMSLQGQKRQQAMHESAKGTAEVAEQTVELDKQNMEDATAALEVSNKAEGQHQSIQAGNYILYDILGSIVNGNRSKAHLEAAMAAYFDMKTQEQAESERILTNSANISKKWVENSR